jgi:hypothetical protein
VRWYLPVILALGRLREEDCEFEAKQGYITRPYLKKYCKITKKAFWQYVVEF